MNDKAYECIQCRGYCNECQVYIPQFNNYCGWKDTIDRDMQKWIAGKGELVTFNIARLVEMLENEESAKR